MSIFLSNLCPLSHLSHLSHVYRMGPDLQANVLSLYLLYRLLELDVYRARECFFDPQTHCVV